MRRFLPDRCLVYAAFSGLLLALAFPSPGLSGLAWVGLVPLLLSMQRRPFNSGFCAGLVFFAIVLYWLNIVMTTYGGLSPVLSVAAYLLLAAYLALFFGTATWAACRLREKLGYPYLLTLPVLWVALEFLREFLLTGFPWASLGYSQQSLWMIQSADLFGVYGLSCLLVFANCVIAAVLHAGRRRDRRLMPVRPLLLLAVLMLGTAGYGSYRLGQDLDWRETSLEAAVIQGNIDQAIKWNPAFKGKTIAGYRSLSHQAHRAGATDLLIWPEAATPFYFQQGGPLADLVRQLPRETGAHLLFGSPAYVAKQGDHQSLNSAFLLSPQGKLLGRSDKVHLVPFGEYVPLKPFLPFIDKLVVGIGDFSPGKIEPLDLNGHALGVLVCYEAIFPGLARDYVNSGSDLLVNITNDAWFGRSSAPAQHLAMVRLRAVENRIWIARAANTGISAFISPSGRITGTTGLFETTYLTARVGLGAQPGLYARMGDLLPGAFLLISLMWLVQTRRRL